VKFGVRHRNNLIALVVPFTVDKVLEEGQSPPIDEDDGVVHTGERSRSPPLVIEAPDVIDDGDR